VRQQDALLRRAQRDRLTLDERLEGTEEAEVDVPAGVACDSRFQDRGLCP
jgi:hypothetical protein